MLTHLLIWCVAYAVGASIARAAEVKEWLYFVHLMHVILFVGVVGALIHRYFGG